MERQEVLVIDGVSNYSRVFKTAYYIGLYLKELL